MNVKIEPSWKAVLEAEFESEYFAKLAGFVRTAYRSGVVYPPAKFIFEAFNRTPFDKVKVVIIGQDPYHNPRQAHGLCFSVNKGIEVPPSLVNIYQELHDDIGFEIPDHGCLIDWAKNGVLLLNAVLTVRAGAANSHRGKGWEIFTDTVIRHLNDREDPIVFLLWGANARAKQALITNPRHLILTAPHPSPLSAYRGFFGCRHFSKANEFLRNNGQPEIDWTIK